MTFNPTEKYQSQIPAIQLLVNLGFTPLSQQQAETLRGGKLRQVLLEEILEKQLLEINQFTVKDKSYPFNIEDAHEAIRKLKPSPEKLKGLRGTNQDIYDLLMLGTTLAKTIDGDSKSYSFRYIDWNHPENNTYHVTAEFSVERTGSTLARRCDIVCFVNGIPFVVIENKAPSIELKKADSQLISYQGEENIPHLFHYAQLLLTMNRAEAKYATVGMPSKFWQSWRDEEDTLEDVHTKINNALNEPQKAAIFSGDFLEARSYFNDFEKEGIRAVSPQDQLIYALCRPTRLLDIVRRFTVFDGGIRKIARHQQYFGIHAALKTITGFDQNGIRQGGVVWHTQGSGKSLTMVMLGRALALVPQISNPRIIIVTDRDDLDKQIKGTFKSCDMYPVGATSGANLFELIENRTPLITTIINKFETATKQKKSGDTDPNIFVLVDESHRSQSGKYGGHGSFALKMRRLLPRACYLGFTGTPLLKQEKNTFNAFGGLIHKYTIDQAVADGAVVPLLYEGRLIAQNVTGSVIDQWFEKISEGLTDEQCTDLKKKFSRISKVSTTEQALQAKVFDVSEHYRKYWQGTGFKAQLVAPSRPAAIRMKEWLDDIGHVTSEVVISPPGDHDGNEEVDAGSKDEIRQFWDQMMKKYGSEDAYNKTIIDDFKDRDDPEILIVVSKLLTGFDAPRNSVLYICKPLKEHNLLQAIARVNRLCEEKGQEKQFGIIIDYEGLLGELDKALTTYSSFSDFDEGDLVGALVDIREEIRKLPQLYDQVWDLFKEVPNKKDMEALEQFLADISIRESFYEHLKVFGRCLHISLSSEKSLDVFDTKTIDKFKSELKHFYILKRRVQVRYQEIVDIRDYESRIQKLLDNNVIAEPAKTIIDPVNINDPDALERVLEEQHISLASKADRIASATKRTITENMAKDPAFYKRFSELLEETISEYRARRISEKDYLNKAKEIAQSVAKKEHGKDFPDSISGQDMAIAFYGVLFPVLQPLTTDSHADEIVAKIAVQIIEIVKRYHIVNMWANLAAINTLKGAIDDYFFDEVSSEIDIPVEILDPLEESLINLAKEWF